MIDQINFDPCVKCNITQLLNNDINLYRHGKLSKTCFLKKQKYKMVCSEGFNFVKKLKRIKDIFIYT